MEQVEARPGRRELAPAHGESRQPGRGNEGEQAHLQAIDHTEGSECGCVWAVCPGQAQPPASVPSWGVGRVLADHVQSSALFRRTKQEPRKPRHQPFCATLGREGLCPGLGAGVARRRADAGGILGCGRSAA